MPTIPPHFLSLSVHPPTQDLLFCIFYSILNSSRSFRSADDVASYFPERIEASRRELSPCPQHACVCSHTPHLFSLLHPHPTSLAHWNPPPFLADFIPALISSPPPAFSPRPSFSIVGKPLPTPLASSNHPPSFPLLLRVTPLSCTYLGLQFLPSPLSFFFF